MEPGLSEKFARIRPREWLVALVYAVVLLCINLYICRDMFHNPTAFMNSMHGFWIALARHNDGSWFHSNWWPYWDGGMPFEFTYSPLIPAWISGWAKVTGISYLLAFQSITGVVYCAGPLTLFAMAWLLTRAPGAAFLAALVYSLTAPTQLIVPDAMFSWDSFWDARRLYILSAWDDTPHLAALALLPLVILFLVGSLGRRRAAYYFPAIALIALMAAASEFGPIEVMMAALCVLFVFRRDQWRQNLVITVVLGIVAYALVLPYLAPSALRAIGRSSANSNEPGLNVASFTAAAIVALGWAVLWQYLPRWTKDWKLQFFVFFAYLTSSVPILAAYLHRQFLPQPGRYKSEMEMGLALVLVFGLRPWFARARPFLKTALVFLLLALAVEQISSHRHYAKAILSSRDETQTIEYRVSTWMEQNLPGARVMLPGSIAQWANAFTNVAQFSGSSWSKALNAVQQRGVAAVFNGAGSAEQDARVSLAWLEAFGVGAVAVSGPQSQEYWKPYAHPAKFDGVLPVLWRADDVTIYRVPQRTSSLAHLIPRTAIVSHSPKSGSDTAEIERYLSAIQDPNLPAPELRWAGTNRMDLRTTISEGQAISIQVSYHPGWHASAGGRAIPLHSDGLGLIWLDPACNGPCDIRLDYDGGWELRLCRYVSLIVLIALVALPFGMLLRSRAKR